MNRSIILALTLLVAGCGPALHLGFFPDGEPVPHPPPPPNQCSNPRVFQLTAATCNGSVLCVNGGIISDTISFGPGMSQCLQATRQACGDVWLPICSTSVPNAIALPSSGEYRPCLAPTVTQQSCTVHASSTMHLRVWDQFSSDPCGIRFDQWIGNGAFASIRSTNGLITYDYRFSDSDNWGTPVNMTCQNGETKAVP